MRELKQFLFERIPHGWYPQTAFAWKDKRALAWFPGNRIQNDFTFAKAMRAGTYGGFSQLAFPDQFKPKQDRCFVCWVGLDIDAEDNPQGIPPITLTGASSRSSASGRGVHVLFRLADPIETTTQSANKIIRRITLPYVDALAWQGVKVCKADRRVFWLTGGVHEWIVQNPEFITPTMECGNFATPVFESSTLMSESVSEWVRWFQERGLVSPGNNRVYIGDCVRELRARGERVETKSRMSGDGQVNGYIDYSETRISLWSWADGHIIWSWTDFDAELEDLI